MEPRDPLEQQRKLIVSKLEEYYPLNYFFQKKYSKESYLSMSNLGMAGEIVRQAFLDIGDDRGTISEGKKRERLLVVDSTLDQIDKAYLLDDLDDYYGRVHNLTPFPETDDDEETRGHKQGKMRVFQRNCLVLPEESMYPDDSVGRSTETQFVLGEPDAAFDYADQRTKHEMRGKLLMFYIGRSIAQAGLDVEKTIETVFDLVRNGLETGFYVQARQEKDVFNDSGEVIETELVPIPDVDDGIKEIMRLGANYTKNFRISLPSKASESVLPAVEKRDVDYLDPFLYRKKGEPGYEIYRLMDLTTYLEQYLANIHYEMTGNPLSIADKTFMPANISLGGGSVESNLGDIEYKNYFSLAELIYHSKYGRLGKFRKYSLPQGVVQPKDPRNAAFIPENKRQILIQDDLHMQDMTVGVEVDDNIKFMSDVEQYYKSDKDMRTLENLGIETLLYLGYMIADYHRESSMNEVEMKIAQYSERLVPVLSKLSLIDSGGNKFIDERDNSSNRRAESVSSLLYLGACMNRKIPFSELFADLADGTSVTSRRYRKANLAVDFYGDLI